MMFRNKHCFFVKGRCKITLSSYVAASSYFPMFHYLHPKVQDSIAYNFFCLCFLSIVTVNILRQEVQQNYVEKVLQQITRSRGGLWPTTIFWKLTWAKLHKVELEWCKKISSAFIPLFFGLKVIFQDLKFEFCQLKL